MAEQSDSDRQSLSIQSTTMDKLDAPLPIKVDEQLQQPHHEVAPTRSDRPVFETRQPYGPPGKPAAFRPRISRWPANRCPPTGFRGLFYSSYVALCAAFSAMGGLLFGYEYVSLPDMRTIGRC